MLLQGDCLKVLGAVKSGSIDLVLCDPPYGTTDCAWDSIIPLAPLWSELRRVTRPNAAMVFFADQPFTTALIASNYMQFRYTWTWIKTMPVGFMNAKRMPLKNTEDVVVFYDKLPVYNPQGVAIIDGKYRPPRRSEQGVYARNGLNKGEDGGYTPELGNYPKQTLHFGKDMPQVHPTQKPVELCAYLIRTYTNVGAHVLDFAMGSGSTGVACVATNRSFTGIEKDPKIFKLAQYRIDGARSPLDKFREPAKRERIRITK